MTNFERHAAEPLLATSDYGYVVHDGARISYALFGADCNVIMLHGGLGHSGNWGNQVPGLVTSGCRMVLIDSRGHGHSTRDERPYTRRVDGIRYSGLEGLDLARKGSLRDSGRRVHCLGCRQEYRSAEGAAVFFAFDMDPSGVKEIEPSIMNSSGPNIPGILPAAFPRRSSSYFPASFRTPPMAGEIEPRDARFPG
jgi:hypothetical protein